jgi:hypothetical protein
MGPLPNQAPQRQDDLGNLWAKHNQNRNKGAKVKANLKGDTGQTQPHQLLRHHQMSAWTYWQEFG